MNTDLMDLANQEGIVEVWGEFKDARHGDPLRDIVMDFLKVRDVEPETVSPNMVNYFLLDILGEDVPSLDIVYISDNYGKDADLLEADKRYQTPSGQFKKMEPVDGEGKESRFNGCVKYMMSNEGGDHSEDSAKNICGSIAKKKLGESELNNNKVKKLNEKLYWIPMSWDDKPLTADPIEADTEEESIRIYVRDWAYSRGNNEKVREEGRKKVRHAIPYEPHNYRKHLSGLTVGGVEISGNKLLIKGADNDVFSTIRKTIGEALGEELADDVKDDNKISEN